MQKTHIPFLDLSVQGNELDILTERLKAVLAHGRLLLGPEHDEFESKIADYCGVSHAVAVGSGTDALFFGMKALDIGYGDEVITTPLSWIASTNAISMLGATPKFVDIAPDLNINPELIEQSITPKTKAILAVDYAGRSCDWQMLQSIAEQYKLLLIEDGSQSFGAKYQGKPVGSFGDMACVSLNPMKLLAAVGEAGVVLVNSDKLAERLNAERYNGMIDKERCEIPSLNGRMDTLQATVLLERLNKFENNISARRNNAQYYNQRFAHLDCIVSPPTKMEEHVYFLYLIKTKYRDELRQFMENRGIEVRIRDNILISQQPAYRNLKDSPLPAAEVAVKELLALPVSEKLTTSDRKYVADAVIEFYEQKQNDTSN